MKGVSCKERATKLAQSQGRAFQGPRAAVLLFRSLFGFFTAFLAATGFDSDALAVAGLAFFLPPKMESHPLAYLSLVPTRVIVTVLPQIQNIVNNRRT